MKFKCLNCGDFYAEKESALDCDCTAVRIRPREAHYICRVCRVPKENKSAAARCCKEVAEFEGEVKFECVGCHAAYGTISEAKKCTCLVCYACSKCHECEHDAVACCKRIRGV